MKRLLLIEFQKLLKNKASKFLIISYFVLLSFIALIASIKFDFGKLKFHIAEQGIFNFPYIWHFNTYIAGYFKLFLDDYTKLKLILLNSVKVLTNIHKGKSRFGGRPSIETGERIYLLPSNRLL